MPPPNGFSLLGNASATSRLIQILQAAYSGELAAAKAYNGHWKSVRDPEEKRRIQEIEIEELEHRRFNGEFLNQLGSEPDPNREKKMSRIGDTISFLCHVTGWFFPMYGAGKLERSNIIEYEEAAYWAMVSGHTEMIDCLLTMAEVEWDHEKFFRLKAASHFFWKIFPNWDVPPPKETIRQRFEQAEVLLAL